MVPSAQWSAIGKRCQPTQLYRLISFLPFTCTLSVQREAQVQKRPGDQAEALPLSLHCLFPRELLRKHAASHLLVFPDLCAENRCPAMGSSWKYPVEGCSGSDFPVKG